ncbi:MAG: sigma-70 region 4 domain-containing protein [Bdellovibrionales bacterium]
MTAVTELSVADAVVKYFFFLSFDEQISFSASLKVLADLKAGNRLDSDHRSHWVQTLHKWKPKLKKIRGRAWSDSPTVPGFILPKDLEVASWVSFMAAADAELVEAVLLSRVLGFSDEEISQGLDVTEGTVRYRVGRGLRHLGGYIES